MESSTSIELLPRGRVFTWVLPVPGTFVSSVGHSYPYPELLQVLYASATNTRGTGTVFSYLPGTSVSSVRLYHNTPNFWKCCKTFIPVPGTSGNFVTFIPVPGTSVSSVRPVPQHPVYRYSIFCTHPELLRVLQARSTIPGTSVSYVTLQYPYPNLLEVLEDSHTLTRNPQTLQNILLQILLHKSRP